MNLHEQREVTYYYDHDGCLFVGARLAGDVPAVTPTAKWYAGEEMDWEHAVSLMFQW